MITTANYLVRATVSGQEYFFEYDTPDMWTALDEFWHEDYPEVLISKNGSEQFPIDVYSMENGHVLDCYPLMFNAPVFHAFYDNGHTASGIYTLDQFDKDIRRDEEIRDENDIIALWSDWCMDYDDEDLWLDYMTSHHKAHCNRKHLQEKWDYCYDKYGSKAAMNMFWRELDRDNRAILTEYITTKYRKSNEAYQA